MICLGWMGANIARRLMKGGQESVVFDRNAETVEALAKEGQPARLRSKRSSKTKGAARRVELPSGAPTEETVGALSKRLSVGDAIVDGGNSF